MESQNYGPFYINSEHSHKHCFAPDGGEGEGGGGWSPHTNTAYLCTGVSWEKKAKSYVHLEAFLEAKI